VCSVHKQLLGFGAFFLWNFTPALAYRKCKLAYREAPQKIRQPALAGHTVPLVQISVPQVQISVPQVQFTPARHVHPVTRRVKVYQFNKTICILPQSRETIPLSWTGLTCRYKRVPQILYFYIILKENNLKYFKADYSIPHMLKLYALSAFNFQLKSLLLCGGAGVASAWYGSGSDCSGSALLLKTSTFPWLTSSGLPILKVFLQEDYASEGKI
jgi:hypothetical protein